MHDFTNPTTREILAASYFAACFLITAYSLWLARRALTMSREWRALTATARDLAHDTIAEHEKLLRTLNTDAALARAHRHALAIERDRVDHLIGVERSDPRVAARAAQPFAVDHDAGVARSLDAATRVLHDTL